MPSTTNPPGGKPCRLYHRPASAKTGQSIAAESTLTTAHVSVYGAPKEGREEQCFAVPGTEDLGEKTVAALSSTADQRNSSLGHSSSVAATLAIAQLDAQRPASLLKGARVSRTVHSTTAHFLRLHRAFGIERPDAWVRRDELTGYLWREVRDPSVMAREAVFYRHLREAKVPSAGIVRVLGNDRRYVEVSTADPEPVRGRIRPTRARSTTGEVHGERANTTGPEPKNSSCGRSLFRSLQFVITESYRCTLRQAIDESRRISVETGLPPQLPAPAVVRFLRDALQQLQYLHASGVTHNMVHPELIVIAPELTDDSDRRTRFARSAAQLVASRRSRSSRAPSEVGSTASFGLLSQTSTSPLASSLPSARESVPEAVPHERFSREPGMFGDLPLCTGKIMDLSSATICDVAALRRLEPLTLSCQRREPESSDLCRLPSLPEAAKKFATPPEWLSSVRLSRGSRPPDGTVCVVRGKDAVRAAIECSERVHSLPRTSPVSGLSFDADDDEADFAIVVNESIRPEPPSDVYMFGQTVRAAFHGLVQAELCMKGAAPKDETVLGRSRSGADIGAADARAIENLQAYEEHTASLRGAVCHLELVGAPECAHFVTQATHPVPTRRLTVEQALAHPFFWTPAMAASFVILLAEFLSVPRLESAADTLATAARGTKAAAAAKARQATCSTKAPAETLNCSKELQRWASVLNAVDLDRACRGSTVDASTFASHDNAMSILSSNDPAVSWLPHVKDWYDALCRTNVEGIRYDYENTVRDHVSFFGNVYLHLRKHGTREICDGDENLFATRFLHERFPGSMMQWLLRLSQTPSDGDKFVSWIQTKGRVDVPHVDSVLVCVRRFVGEQRHESADRQRSAELARARAATAGRRLRR